MLFADWLAGVLRAIIGSHACPAYRPSGVAVSTEFASNSDPRLDSSVDDVSSMRSSEVLQFNVAKAK